MNHRQLGEYMQMLPNRVLSTKGLGMETGMPGDQNAGPVNSPITDAGPGCPSATPASDNVPELLRAINDSLIAVCQKIGVSNMNLELATDTIQNICARQFQPPDDAISFISTPTSGTVSVPPAATAGNSGTIVTQIEVPERCTGYLLRIAPTVDPVSAADQVNWQVRVDGSAHPGLNGNLPVNAMKEHLPFFWKVPPGKTIELVAVNTGSLNVNCAGFLIGYFEPIKLDSETSPGGFAS